MKKVLTVLLALMSVGVIVLAAGCEKTSEKAYQSDPSAVTESETVSEKGGNTDTPTPEQTELHFKTGTWATSNGTNYVFYENGKDGKTVNVAEGTGLGFEYELDADGNGVFHIGSADDITKVTVEFMDGGDDTATVKWEDGSSSVLMFVSEDISDDFSYHYVMGQITRK